MTRHKKIEGVYIHEKAIVETERISGGTHIWAFTHILEKAVIGKNCNICDHTFIESDVVIGDNVTIKSGVYLWDGLRIEDDVFIGPNATFTNDIRPRSKVYPAEYVKTHILKGASIGANATIMCGITVGAWAMVGAGSTVTKDVPDYSLVFGVPAKIQGYVCECGKNLIFENTTTECACGKAYQLNKDGVVRKK
ncbi:MAG: N-acetyltransferase [Sedimentisphaerales bacterium]|nr:N-acetyltransferase [Sedimentisphaerales bacterium]